MLPNDILLAVKFYYYPHLSLFVKSLENIWPTFTFAIVIFLVLWTLQTARVVIYFSRTLIFVRNYFLVFYYVMNDNLLWISRVTFSIVVRIININKSLFEGNQEIKWIIK